MASNITFDIIGRDRSGSDAFNKVATSANRADGAMSKFSAGAMKVAKAGMFALGAGAVIAGKGLYEMAQSAAQDEAAQKKLALTLKNTTGATDAQIASVERWITAQGKALGVADDDLRPALQRLAEGSGDVAEAQRLASIAMDASAGTGRSLKSVSEALLRAQNGAIGGLSRYGIATKDAKGETLSFEEVTRKMAQTFEGQAEKAADTTAGKFARLKLILSETGEEIGAKLIPYASDLADAFMDKGVPAIESFGDKAGPVFRNLVEAGGDIKDAVQPAVEEIAEALGNLATEGKGAGQAFDNVFLPALRATADVVAGVVDFVDDLPGPIKDIGAQAAIAAVILPKLTGAVAATSGAMAALSTGARDAEKRMSALKGVAGIAGMLAISDAAGRAEGSLSTLETAAGGALLGFSLAGPWGAAVGAGAGALVALSRETDNAGDAMVNNLPKVDSMTDSLDALTGAITGAARADAVAALRGQIEGLVDLNVTAMDQTDLAEAGILGISAAIKALPDGTTLESLGGSFGLSMRTIGDAALGNKAAIRTVNQAFREHRDGTLATADKITVLRHALGLVNDGFRENQREVRENARLTQELTGKLKGVPKDVRTKVMADGVPVTVSGLAKLATRYKDLDNKQIRTLIEAANLPFTVKQVRDFQKELDETDKKRPKPKFDADGKAFDARAKHVRETLADLDRSNAVPKADLDLGPFFNQRAVLMNSLNSIPDENVSIWVTRRNVGGGGPSGGGPDLGLPASRTTGRVAASRFAAVQERVLTRSSDRGATSRRTVVEVRNVLELDWTRAKTQIKDEVRVIAGEIARDEIREERTFERQQR